MTRPPAIFEGGGFSVSRAVLRTPRKTYAMDRIEFVSVQRTPLLMAGIPAIGVFLSIIAFWPYLYPHEILLGLLGSSAVIAAGTLFGTLRVHSLALGDGELATSLGLITTLRHVRLAVEEAIQDRHAQAYQAAHQEARNDEPQL